MLLLSDVSAECSIGAVVRGEQVGSSTSTEICNDLAGCFGDEPIETGCESMLARLVEEIDVDGQQTATFGVQLGNCALDVCLSIAHLGCDLAIGWFLEFRFNASHDGYQLRLARECLEQKFSRAGFGQCELCACMNCPQVIQVLLAGR